MLGLVVLAFLSVYLLISVIAVRMAIRHAKRIGRNPKWWGLGAALIMYNLLFWEVVPTILANEYYCRTLAGSEIYKSVEQWSIENPGASMNPNGTYLDRYELHDRVGVENVPSKRFVTNRRKIRPLPILSTTLIIEEVVDRGKGEVLARAVSVGHGYGSPMLGGGWRAIDWFDLRRCYPGREEFVAFQKKLVILGTLTSGDGK